MTDAGMSAERLAEIKGRMQRAIAPSAPHGNAHYNAFAVVADDAGNEVAEVRASSVAPAPSPAECELRVADIVDAPRLALELAAEVDRLAALVSHLTRERAAMEGERDRAAEREREECAKVCWARAELKETLAARAREAGREKVALCRQSDAETAFALAAEIRGRKP